MRRAARGPSFHRLTGFIRGLMTHSGKPDPRAPNFFILGAAKSGTTSLYQFLQAHPAIFLPTAKEAHFFSSDRYESAGIDQYLDDYFSGSEHFPARGEATPAYFHLGDLVAPRMLATLGPGLRFILVLRDPVRRAWSHYLHTHRLGLEDRSFEEIVAARDAETSQDKIKWRSYYSDGLYARQLRTWQRHFAPEQFLVFLTEDLGANPERVAARCFDFLGVKKGVAVSTSHRSNVARGARFRFLARVVNRPTAITNRLKGVLPASVRARLRSAINSWNRQPLSGDLEIGPQAEQALRRAYASDVRELQPLIGRDLSRWLPEGVSAEP
jgi:hypothetical protein